VTDSYKTRLDLESQINKAEMNKINNNYDYNSDITNNIKKINKKESKLTSEADLQINELKNNF